MIILVSISATAVLVDELAADDVTRLLAQRAGEAKWLAKTQRAAAARPPDTVPRR